MLELGKIEMRRSCELRRIMLSHKAADLRRHARAWAYRTCRWASRKHRIDHTGKSIPMASPYSKESLCSPRSSAAGTIRRSMKISKRCFAIAIVQDDAIAQRPQAVMTPRRDVWNFTRDCNERLSTAYGWYAMMFRDLHRVT